MAKQIEWQWHGQALRLTGEGAVHWIDQDALLIADPHWGKTVAFQARGIPLPAQPLPADLTRLSALLRESGARRLFILGDLLHAKESRAPHTEETVGRWRADWPDLAITLVRGNHDRRAGDPPPEWGMRVVDQPLRVGPLLLCHEPETHPAGPVLAGHLHPGARLVGAGGQAVMLPCYWFSAAVAVLPAFGSFTGCSIIQPQPGDHVFVLAEGEVMAV